MSTNEKTIKQKIKPYTPFFVVLCLLILLTTVKIKDMTTDQTITLIVPEAGTTIYLNNKKARTTKRDNDEIKLSPKVGTNFILANKDDSWPWQKNLVTQKGSNYTASVFTTKRTPMFSLVPEYILEETSGVQNDAYRDIIKLFENIPAKQTSSNGLVSIEITPDGRNVSATWLGEKIALPRFFCDGDVCEETFLVLPVNYPIRQISFYPARDDRIVFSTRTAIWVIELDRNDIQNAQPLYLGKKPEFVRGPGHNLYIRDRGKIMLMNL